MQLVENVFLSNCISQVQKCHVVANVINNSEENIEIPKVNLNDIEWEVYLNNTFYTINISKVNLKGQTVILNRIQMSYNELELRYLTNKKRENVAELCREFTDIFHLTGDYLTYTITIQHDVELEPHTTPINIRPYCLPYLQKLEINEQVVGWENQNPLTPSKSSWNFLLIVILKKEDRTGKTKFKTCIDYRKLNANTIVDAYPLRRIDEISVNNNQLRSAKYFTTLDLVYGYPCGGG